MCACVCVCVCVRKYVYAYIYTRLCVYTHTQPHHPPTHAPTHRATSIWKSAEFTVATGVEIFEENQRKTASATMRAPAPQAKSIGPCDRLLINRSRHPAITCPGMASGGQSTSCGMSRAPTRPTSRWMSCRTATLPKAPGASSVRSGRSMCGMKIRRSRSSAALQGIRVGRLPQPKSARLWGAFWRRSACLAARPCSLRTRWWRVAPAQTRRFAGSIAAVTTQVLSPRPSKTRRRCRFGRARHR